MPDGIFDAKWHIDVVFCIDGTARMDPCIESIKSNVRRFYLELGRTMVRLGSDIDSMRVKVIVFRDYLYDGEHAIVESPFFNLPSEEAEFSAYLGGIKAKGGYGEFANGLEALYLAMKSDFSTEEKGRQVIVLYSNGDALEFNYRSHKRGYPKDMVDETGFIEMWGCMAQDSDFKLRGRKKRLVLFAPEGTRYQALKSKLNRSVFVPMSPTDDFNRIDPYEIIKIWTSSAVTE